MKKPLILIAEDDIDDRFLLQSAFMESGSREELAFVENGVKVLEFLAAIVEHGEKAIYPEIIMLDLNMPKKNGKEVLVELKQHEIFRKIPVIIYTTTTNEIEVKKCYELGATTYIVKPVSFEAMRDIVHSIRNTWLSPASISIDG